MNAPLPSNNLASNHRRDTLIRKGIKLQHLRLIAAIQETGQISRAAEMLMISQPAASRLVTELVQITGVELYERHPRGIVLNTFGELLAARAHNLLRELGEAGQEIEQLSTGTNGLVRIGSVTGPAIEHILPAIKATRVSYPKIDVSVNVDISDVLAEDLLADRLDFYLGRVPLALDPRQFDIEYIEEEPMDLVVRANHPLTQLPAATLADCVKYDWVLQCSGGLMRQTVERYLLANSAQLPRKFLSTSSLLLTLAAIVESNSVAPVASSVARFLGPDGLGGNIVSLPVARDLAVSAYSLISMANRKPSPATALFLKLLTR